jgi:hypothetical protein
MTTRVTKPAIFLLHQLYETLKLKDFDVLVVTVRAEIQTGNLSRKLIFSGYIIFNGAILIVSLHCRPCSVNIKNSHV